MSAVPSTEHLHDLDLEKHPTHPMAAQDFIGTSTFRALVQQASIQEPNAGRSTLPAPHALLETIVGLSRMARVEIWRVLELGFQINCGDLVALNSQPKTRFSVHGICLLDNDEVGLQLRPVNASGTPISRCVVVQLPLRTLHLARKASQR